MHSLQIGGNMKKYRFKKWFSYLLGFIAFFSFCIMGSDCEDLNVFIISHLIATGVFILTMTLLNEYGGLN